MKKVFLSTLFLLLAQVGHAGPRVIGNGGDVYALQFVTLADKVLSYLQNAEIKGVDLNALAQAIEITTVESTTKALFLNGLPKDAINYPDQKKIIFNRISWSQLITEEKLALVLHEYLGILRIEDASYKFSKQLLRDFDLREKIVRGSDSTWMLCQEESLILNTFEHRRGMDGRETNLSLLFGSSVFKGSLIDVDNGFVGLTDGSKARNFTGDISIDYSTNRVSVKGILSLDQFIMPIDTTMKCEVKSRP